jgi:hypothetical protein
VDFHGFWKSCTREKRATKVSLEESIVKSKFAPPEATQGMKKPQKKMDLAETSSLIFWRSNNGRTAFG